MPYLNLDPTTATAVVTSLGAPLTNQEETLASMQDELLAMLGGRDDIDPARLTRWINQAYRDIGSSIDIPEFNVGISFSTVVSQPLYLLPTTLVRTKRAAMIDTVNYSSDGGIPLTKIDPDFYRGLPDQGDVPSRYFFQNRLIVMYPTPNQVKTIAIDAYIRPQQLVSATDSPVFGVEWYEPLLLAARAKAFRSLLEFERGDKAENDFVSSVRRKHNSRADEREGMIAAFRPARSFRSINRHSPPREDY